MESLIAELPGLLLVSCRVAGVTTASPVFHNRFTLPQVRVALTFLISLLLVPSTEIPNGSGEGLTLILACVLELVTGLVIGFFNHLLFSVVQMAGSILDFDMGLSMAQLMDPVSTQSEPLLGTFFRTLALVLYFVLDAHHWLLLGLAQSYELHPIGALSISQSGLFSVVLFFRMMLSVSIKMVLPFTVVMLLTTAMLAVANRAVQQMHVFQLGLGIKAVAGMGFLGVLLPYFLGLLEPLFQLGYDTLVEIMQQVR